MHIAIDARMYGTKNRGIGRYLMKLIEGLEEIESAPPSPTPPNLPSGRGGNCYTIFLRKENFEEYQPKNPHFKKAIWDAPWYGWREQFTRYTLHVTRYDLVHFSHWNVPLLFRQPFVVTIHDLELFSSNRTRDASTRGRLTYWLKHLAFRVVFRHAVLAARAIIVPSNVVREQLLDMYPQVRRKAKVIYEAPTLDHDSITTVQQENNLPEYYLLYVGAAYPHKNLPRLLEAWEIVHKELPEYKLVLVGREDYFWKKLKQEWNTPTPPLPPLLTSPRAGEEIVSGRGTLSSGRGGNDSISPPLGGGVRGGVIFYGEATDAELAALYQNAALLVQPSLEEGFSLPPLEALSFGTPVAVSDIPVHREILHEAALFFDPHDTSAIAKALREVLTNESIRTQILSHAAELTDRYSWSYHAADTLEVYQSC